MWTLVCISLLALQDRDKPPERAAPYYPTPQVVVERMLKLGELKKGDPVGDKVLGASIAGDRKTLVTDAVIPATMAVIYLCLLLYFGSIGGYKVVRLSNEEQRE